MFKFGNPTEDEDVVIALRRAQRIRHRRPGQALGLTADLRDRLIAACPDDLAGRRDRALISVGYDTLCRRSELVAFRLEDLTRLADGGMLALIRRAKNDPFGDGREGYVSKRSVAMLDEWLRAAEIDEGWLFRRIVFDGVGPNPLHPHSVGRILKQRAAAAGASVDVVDALSGHSMRVGAAQDMMAAGMGLLPIMKTGGWKSANVVARYVQNARPAGGSRRTSWRAMSRTPTSCGFRRRGVDASLRNCSDRAVAGVDVRSLAPHRVQDVERAAVP